MVPPVGPKFPNFQLGQLPQQPCAVAPNQGRNAYEGACCTGEAVAGDVGGQYHSGVLYYWGGYPLGRPRRTGEGTYSRGSGVGPTRGVSRYVIVKLGLGLLIPARFR